MTDIEIKLLIAQGLWNCYEGKLPDTPQRVAEAVIYILERQGLQIGAVHQ